MVARSEQASSGCKRKKRQSRKPQNAPLTRSENMSRIRGKDTKPEMTVRRVLWAAGLRYRLHDKRLPGNPDLIFAARRTVIFVHGCFWHCHDECSNFRIPKTRTDWWTAKLMRNKARDVAVRNELEAVGWRVIVIWECQVENRSLLNELIRKLNSI